MHSYPLIRPSATFSLKGEGVSGRLVLIRITKKGEYLLV